MNHEMFLLAGIREERDAGPHTDRATATGVSRAGRLVSLGILILLVTPISLSRMLDVGVETLATGLASGIIVDATVVHGVLALAVVT